MWNVKMIVVATFALGVSGAFADKLSDFEAAAAAVDANPAGKGGCTSIPYSDLKGNCESQGSQVHEWCDGKKGPVTCGSESITRQLKDKIEREKKAAEALKEKKTKLESDRSRASTDDEKNKLSKEIEQVEKDIYEQEQRVGQAQKDLEARKKHVDEAIYTLDKCIDYRRAVMNTFAAALDKVRSEDETPRIKELARKLRNSYEAGKPGHEEQISNKANALKTCQDSRP